MNKSEIARARPLFLGLECGGTRSVAILADAQGRMLDRVEAGPANSRLLDLAQLAGHFRDLARRFPMPDALGIGIAGAREEQDRKKVRDAAAQAWPGVPCHAGNDLETALAAAELGSPTDCAATVIIISGTGSCCYGRARSGATAKVGGWGHLLGDKGSGYDIALRALQTIIERFDREGAWPRMGQRLLRACLLNEPNELIDWVHRAAKAELAALAIEVFHAAEQREPLALSVIEHAADTLARDATACMARLARAGQKVRFVLTGGVLLKQRVLARMIELRLRTRWPQSRVEPLAREGAWGAVALAREASASSREERQQPTPRMALHTAKRSNGLWGASLPRSAGLSHTEERNPLSLDLDRRSPASAIQLMLSQDAAIPAAILAHCRKLDRAVRLITRSFRNGGRLFYVGAGTSGRIGVLDASECPPTFSTPPDMVQGIIAGGQTALWTSIEGAEDDADGGAKSMMFRRVRSKDVVVGIAASGTTPFVWGALIEAKRRRATTILLCFNPRLRVPPRMKPDIVICPDVGPEVLTGSTRLKAGTATKLVLNVLTTLSMVRLGKVVSNLMVDVRPANVKLRARAVRIVRELAQVDENTARAALEEAGWVVKAALDGFRAQGGGVGVDRD